MKTIVFATDFSSNSRKAAETAAQIALKTNSELIIFHAFRTVMPYETEMSEIVFTARDLERHSMFMLKKLCLRLKKKFSEDLKIELVAKEGLVIDALKVVLKDSQADLLVMGSVGDSPFGAKYFGSLATTMIHQTHVPLLLVPPKTKFSFFKNTIIGLDFFHEVDLSVLEKTVGVLRDFDAVVNLISISDEPTEARKEGIKIREILKNVPHTFTVVEGDDFTKAVLQFAKDNSADLIITFPRKHSLFERIFAESNTERLAFNDDIPILAVV